ncbi:MAG TPA: hypothetical protein VF805_04690 [Anaeromyxobacteraceae bacterium]
MHPAARYVLLAAALAGGLGGFLLFSTFRDPCGGLLRRYVATYDAAKAPCREDADCVLDPLPAGGPGLCDRARATSSARQGLEDLERRWVERGCPAPGAACPPAAAARCQKGRCATALR